MENNDQSATATQYQRIVLKISGEVLGNHETGEALDSEILKSICTSIKDVYDMGVEIGLVVGGGNIFRGLAGATDKGTDRTTGDHMGMLATAINALALMDCLEKMDVDVRVLSAVPMDRFAEPFILRRAVRHLEKKRVVIFACGTGNPYFSTDTCAALRASEIGAQVIMKATKVDGIYDKDPMKFEDAVKYNELSYTEALSKRLQVMDSTAFSLCMDNAMPILVFNMNETDSIKKAVQGNTIGTIVK